MALLASQYDKSIQELNEKQTVCFVIVYEFLSVEKLNCCYSQTDAKSLSYLDI